jgi:hypothetical protein
MYLCILTAAFASLALCQEFEVVSVRPNKSTSYNSSFTTDRDRLAATNVSLRGLIWRAYGLVVAKSGIKFKHAPAADCASHSRNNSGTHFVGTCVSMDAFAAFLAKRGRDLPIDLPVLDMTGLQGFYNLKLDWVVDSTSGVILPIALEEQLGLKLETRKAPIEILVVDSARRTPSEN